MEAIRWDGARLWLLDQRVLPHETRWVGHDHPDEVAASIRDMVVRGAPAIAIAAGYGLVLAERRGVPRPDASRRLLAARPTAVNLRWALERLEGSASIEADAGALHREDREINESLGAHGAPLLRGGVLTICNTGALATGGHGTALGMVRSARAAGRDVHVFALETRPFLQGARLTAYECLQDGIPCTLLTDGMAGALLASGLVQDCIVGCDRVAQNGDTANKIGTYQLAVLCRHHGVPFYVAMPWSTYDERIATGAGIAVEERDPDEVRGVQGHLVAPREIPAWNPAFDITPASLVTAWVTERGVVRSLPLPSRRAENPDTLVP